MKKIESLEELRKYIAKVITDGLNEICGPDGCFVGRTGWRETRTVLTTHKTNGIRLCRRTDKLDGETELIVLIKTMAENNDEGGPIGLTTKNWNKIMSKSAAWLEKQGLYIDRHVITDETPDLFKSPPAKENE